MPTLASQPSLKNTQAVGAILLHQFARERFLEAGINENLIDEAENQENVERLFRDDEDDIDEKSQLDTSKTSTSDLEHVNESTNHNNQTSTNNSTGDQYQSYANFSTNSHENTVWHSIDDASLEEQSKRDRLQASVLASYGRELRKLADEFEKTRFRREVKDKAEEVNLKEITKEGFVLLLKEVFQGGVTRSKIVSLFFFCTDVALRATSLAQELVVKLLGWSLSYIINIVCKHIYDIGGWDSLFRKLPSMLYNSCALLGVAVILFYLHKSLRASS